MFPTKEKVINKKEKFLPACTGSCFRSHVAGRCIVPFRQRFWRMPADEEKRTGFLGMTGFCSRKGALWSCPSKEEETGAVGCQNILRDIGEIARTGGDGRRCRGSGNTPGRVCSPRRSGGRACRTEASTESCRAGIRGRAGVRRFHRAACFLLPGGSSL